ncbi:hypothetical protein ACFO3D_00635 [Virgibacillus kekensis]|uniref:Uncharacterized protein n=1 Tax=Virgibacillus kekensis TaxID=202261 RepID=A0ABV9DD81_9BACI
MVEKSKVLLIALGVCTLIIWTAAIMIFFGQRELNQAELHTFTDNTLDMKEEIMVPVNQKAEIMVHHGEERRTLAAKSNTVLKSNNSNKVSIDVLLELINSNE